VSKGILYQFAFDYTDQHRADFKKYADVKVFDNGFSITPGIYAEYVAYAGKNSINATPRKLFPLPYTFAT